MSRHLVLRCSIEGREAKEMLRISYANNASENLKIVDTLKTFDHASHIQ